MPFQENYESSDRAFGIIQFVQITSADYEHGGLSCIIDACIHNILGWMALGRLFFSDWARCFHAGIRPT